MPTLIIHHGALGDWVLTFPLLRGLGAGTVAVTALSKARLAAAVIPGVTAVDGDRPAWSALFVRDGPTPAPDALAGAERIISFVSEGDDAWALNVRRLAPRAHLAFVPPRPPPAWNATVTAWHRYRLSQQGVELPDVPLPIRPNPGGPVLLHPGSGGRDKCWPLPRFIALAHLLSQHGYPVRFVVGEAEIERASGEVQELSNMFHVEQPQRLEALHLLLTNARLYIGNDAGPTHLAAQMGVPTLALFGPTDPTVWAPQGPAVALLAPPRPQPMTWLNAPLVLDACIALSAAGNP